MGPILSKPGLVSTVQRNGSGSSSGSEQQRSLSRSEGRATPTTSDGKLLSLAVQRLQAKELDASIKFVRLTFLDVSNIQRVRVLPVDRFLRFLTPGAIAINRGVTMNSTLCGLLAYHDQLASGLPPSINVSSEIIIVPDVYTLKRLPYGSGTHATCLSHLEEKDLSSDLRRIPLEACPRTCLRNILASAKDQGISFLVGFESEVIFLSKVDPPVPIDNTTYCSSTALHSVQTCIMLEEIVEALRDQGISVAQFHADSAPGQFQFVTDPDHPLQAADNLVRTRDTIYNVAAKYNLRATFAPKVFADFAGSATHCHISIRGPNNFDELNDATLCNSPSEGGGVPPGLSSLEENFMSGILIHLGSVAAFTLPNVTSYDRVQEDVWAGVYIGWGVDNRDATLRLAYKEVGRFNRRKYTFELKCIDGTANPYLALAAILTAGLDGIQKDLKLPSKELTMSPSSLSYQERMHLGMTDKLPASVEEAMEALRLAKEYDVFTEHMGKSMVDLFLAVRTSEVARMNTLTKAEQLKFVIQTY